MKRSQAQILQFRKMLIACNLVFSALMVGLAVFVAANDDDALFLVILTAAGIATALLNLLVALIVLAATHSLLNHIKIASLAVGKALNTVIMRKLQVSGVICPLCFGTYSLMIFISIYDEELYLRYDAYFNLVVKLSHVVGFMTCAYMFSGHGKGEAAKKQRSQARSALPAYGKRISTIKRSNLRTGRGRGRGRTRDTERGRDVTVTREEDSQNAHLDRSQENEEIYQTSTSERKILQGELLKLDRDCSQCGLFKPEAEGQWDEEDGGWYCKDCCAVHEANLQEMKIDFRVEDEEEYEEYAEDFNGDEENYQEPQY